MIRASDIDWLDFHPFFHKTEWPNGALERMDARIIDAIYKLRISVPKDHGFIPSPLLGAHVRDAGTSQHSNEGGRLSTATDFFVDREHVWEVWKTAQRIEEIGGIGIYFGSWLGDPIKQTPMMHIDVRPERILWAAFRERHHSSQKYVYFNSNPVEFFKILSEYGDYK